MITRLFAADIYGQFAALLSLASLLTPVLTLTIDRAIPIAKSKDDVNKRLTDSIEITVSIALYLLPFALLFGGLFIAGAFGSHPVIWFVSLLEALSLIVISANITESRHRDNALSDVISSLTLSLSRIAFGLTGLISASSLVVSYIFSQLIRLRVLTRMHTRNQKFHVLTPSLVVQRVRDYSDFAKYTFPSQFLTTASSSLPVILLSTYDMKLAGCYAIAQRIIKYPIEFFVGPVRGLNVKAFSSTDSDPKRILTVLNYFLFYHTFLATLISLGIWFLSSSFVDYILGQHYADVKHVLIWLIPLLFANIISAPINSLCIATGLQKQWLSNEAISALLRTLLLFLLFGVGAETQVLIIAFSCITFFVKIPLLARIYFSIYRTVQWNNR